MKKILLGFIAIGLLAFVGCRKDDYTNSQLRFENGETPLDLYQSGVPVDSIIGKVYQGGLIAYLDTLDGTGLIAAPTDQENALWGCYPTLIAGADELMIGYGEQNTADILAGCKKTNTAAYLCDTLTLGGYSDWFLPAKDELNLLYVNLHKKGLGGFVNDLGYSSSTENDNFNAWGQDFINGYQDDFNKYNLFSVRAVRAF